MPNKVHRFWKYGAVISILMTISLATDNWYTQKSMQDIFNYNVDLLILDAKTGEPISDFITGAPSISSADMFQQTYGMYGGTDGKITVSGIGYEPRQWTIEHRDYESATLIIDEDTPRKLNIQLEQKRSNKSQ
jgi:hypothetical protein